MIRLIVGLGNPGQEYEETRHNFGRQVVLALAEQKGLSWRNWEGQKLAKLAKSGGQPIYLLLPEDYMNRSGEAISQVASYYEIETSETLIVADELDFPLGKIELRRGGHHAGHRGLQSTAALLGDNDFWRLRLGIDRPAGENRNSEAVSQYVLGRFSESERSVRDKVIDETVKILLDLTSKEPIGTIKSVL